MKLDRNGIVGAVPEEDLHWKKAIACEGQKLYIECPIIYNRIQVQSTFYGRDDTVTCKHPQLPSSKICAEQNVTVKNVVMDLCQGVEKCEVSATNDFLAQFGTIICPNVYKYLYVKYRCVPKNALADAPGLSPYDHTASVTKVVNTNYAPVQCCYVVPGTSTSQTTTSVGGTIIRHNHGIQSVEERIVSEQPQVHKVTEIIPNHPAQLQIQNPVTQPAKIHLARITLPGVSRLQLNTMVDGGHERGTHLIRLGPAQIRSNIWGLQKKNVITKPHLLQRNITHVVPKTLTRIPQGAKTHFISFSGRSKIRNDSERRHTKERIRRRFLSQINKRRFKSKRLKNHTQFFTRTSQKLKFQKMRKNIV